MIMHCPPKLSRILSPATAGLVDLQQVSTTRDVIISDAKQIVPDIDKAFEAANQRSDRRSREIEATPSQPDNLPPPHGP